MDEWFETWFDTKYYQILYKNRDDAEAEAFLDRLIGQIPILTDHHILDLACGSGRHSHYLSSLGYRVTGTDLSGHSIEQARKRCCDAEFIVQDMRNPLPGKEFDVVLNLFTSFGYFDSVKDNESAVKAIRRNLKPNGTLVIDFLNADSDIRCLPGTELKSVDGIEFEIQKKISCKKIRKNISFVAEGVTHAYFEEVELLRLSDFQELLASAGLAIVGTYGNYRLEPWSETSERLILIAKPVQ